jgi:hypothetical protein
MKQVLIFITGGVVGVVVMLLLCTSGYMPVDCSCSIEAVPGADTLPPDQGVLIDTNQFAALESAFQNQVLPPTVVTVASGAISSTETAFIHGDNLGKWGGKIGALALMDLVNGLENPEDKFIDYRFGLMQEGGVNKTFLLFYRKSGLRSGEEAPAIFLRSADDAESFCPTVCTLDN